MAYDAALLTQIETAIASLVAGTRTVSLTMGDKTIQYGITKLDDLRAFRNEVALYIRADSDKPRFVLTQTSKGL